MKSDVLYPSANLNVGNIYTQKTLKKKIGFQTKAEDYQRWDIPMIFQMK